MSTNLHLMQLCCPEQICTDLILNAFFLLPTNIASNHILANEIAFKYCMIWNKFSYRPYIFHHFIFSSYFRFSADHSMLFTFWWKYGYHISQTFWGNIIIFLLNLLQTLVQIYPFTYYPFSTFAISIVNCTIFFFWTRQTKQLYSSFRSLQTQTRWLRANK